MQHILTNEVLTVKVHTQGAELCSIITNKNGRDYVWSGEPEVWARHAPILFPIVGKLKQNRYIYNGKEYNLPQHGFARDMDFTLVYSGEDELHFELRDTQNTLKVFPFKFLLQVKYKLTGNILTTEYRTVNTDENNTLRFGIGAHPGFSILVNPNEEISDYYLEFSDAETLNRQPLASGLRQLPDSVPYLSNSRTINLSDDIFADDALIFKGPVSDYILLANHNGDYSLKLGGISTFPYLGIWAKHGAPFVCIEPCIGIHDSVSSDMNFENKEGNIILEPGEAHSCAFTVTIGVEQDTLFDKSFGDSIRDKTS